VTATQPAALVGNGLDLMMTEPDPVGEYQIHMLADETDWGSPEAVISQIQSQLQDGDTENVDRYGNRQVPLRLEITAPLSDAPGAAIARAQKLIETTFAWPGGQVRPLAWTPPLAGAETSVFEMTSAYVDKEFDDLGEALNGRRVLKLTVGARPFVRSVEPITIAAPAVLGSTTTTVDSGSSATGWSMLSTAPAASKNLVPNPRLGANATGWVAYVGAASVTRVGTTGDFWLSVNPTPSATQAYCAAPIASISPSTSYALSVVVDGGGVNITQSGFIFQWMDGSGAVIGANGAVVGSPGVEKRFSGVFVSPSNAAFVRIFPFVKFGKLGDRPNFLASQAMVSPGTTVLPYADGGTPNTAAVTYSWDGTANNSTSTITWTAPSLAASAGAVKGTVYGRTSANIRRNASVSMSSLPYLRIKGTATAASSGQITVADRGLNLTPYSYSYTPTTGAYEILVKRPTGFTSVDVTFNRTDGAISTTDGVFVAVDQIDITDNPFGTGYFQTRQVPIRGSQRTELSLSVLGLDGAGVSSVPLGDQVLVYTAAAGDDSRLKFASCRLESGTGGTADSTSVSGFYNTLGTTASATSFSLSAAKLRPGTYNLYARLMPLTNAAHTISFRRDLNAGTPFEVLGAWQTWALGVGASYPAIPLNTWRIVCIGAIDVLADASDNAVVKMLLAAEAASVVRVDDLWLAHQESGQANLLNTAYSGGTFSAVRVDAATPERAQPSAWVGEVNSTMLDAARTGRCQIPLAQHQAAPGLLQVVSITPGCTTSRLAGEYYARAAHDIVNDWDDAA
jgi:hypothetical protein